MIFSQWLLTLLVWCGGGAEVCVCARVLHRIALRGCACVAPRPRGSTKALRAEAGGQTGRRRLRPRPGSTLP